MQGQRGKSGDSAVPLICQPHQFELRVLDPDSTWLLLFSEFNASAIRCLLAAIY